MKTKKKVVTLGEMDQHYSNEAPLQHVLPLISAGWDIDKVALKTGGVLM
jgi:hypothetical protein